MKTRTPEQILRIITDFAESDDRIRAVLMTGSRVDPDANRDPFQDYDIMFLVEDIEPFRDRSYVLSRFGAALVTEEPLIGPWPPHDADDGYYNYNVQLADGNRVDLVFRHTSLLLEALDDSLIAVLLDKDHRIPTRPAPNASSCTPVRPTETLYKGCCTGFFFTLGSHIPKTIWRQKLPLLKFYIEACLRDALVMMLSWEIGIRTGWTCSVGKKGKDLATLLPTETWKAYERTYVGYDPVDLWNSLFQFHNLFEHSAQFVAEKLGFPFPQKQSNQVLGFLRHVRDLPDDAESIY